MPRIWLVAGILASTSDGGGGGGTGGGSGIATPRVGTSNFLQAIPPDFLIGYAVNINNPARNFANTRQFIEENFNAIVGGNAQKPSAWLQDNGQGSATRNGQGLGSVNDIRDYTNARGIPLTNMSWHQMLAPFQQGSFITGSNGGNFQSRINQMMTEAQQIAAPQLNQRVDVVNELLSATEAGNYGRRLFKGGFPFVNSGSNVNYCRQIFQNARTALPNARLFWLDIGGVNAPQYGFNTVQNQVGTAGSVTSFRRTHAQMAGIQDLLDNDIPIDGFGLQWHFRQGEYHDFQVMQAISAEMGARGVALEATEVDLGERNQNQGGAGNLSLTPSAEKLAASLLGVYNANPKSEAVTLWENFQFEIFHDYAISRDEGPGDNPNLPAGENDGRPPGWVSFFRDNFLARIYPAIDRPKKGMWGRRLIDQWITNQNGSGFLRSGAYGESLGDLNGSTSSDGQFNARTGLKLLPGRSLRVSWNFFERNAANGGGRFIDNQNYTIKAEIRREDAGNGNPIVFIRGDDPGDFIQVETGAANRLRLRIQRAGQQVDLLTTQVFQNNEERRMVMSISPAGVTISVSGTSQTLAAPASGMPTANRLHMGGNPGGSAVSNWRLGYIAAYEGTRSSTILNEVSGSPWGTEDPLSMLDPDSIAGGGAGAGGNNNNGNNGAGGSTPSDIAIIDAATLVSQGGNWAAGGNFTTSGGSLLVLIQEESNAGRPTGVTYGGQSLTRLSIEDSIGDGFGATSSIWFLSEAGVAAATDNALTADATPVASTTGALFALTLSNVDQGSPLVSEDGATTQSGTLGGSANLTTVAGGRIFAIAGNNANFNGGTSGNFGGVGVLIERRSDFLSSFVGTDGTLTGSEEVQIFFGQTETDQHSSLSSVALRND